MLKIKIIGDFLYDLYSTKEQLDDIFRKKRGYREIIRFLSKLCIKILNQFAGSFKSIYKEKIDLVSQ